MDIYSKARELAKLIEESAELNNLKKLEAEVYHNEESINLTREYSSVYNDLVTAIKGQDEEEISLLKNTYQEVMNKIKNNELTKDMFEAKDKFDKVIETVNKIINHAITGHEDSNCSDGSCCSCSSCK